MAHRIGLLVERPLATKRLEQAVLARIGQRRDLAAATTLQHLYAFQMAVPVLVAEDPAQQALHPHD